mgnify:CR=1 FL=1
MDGDDREVERVDLGQGTTGRFHGLLHSGGRYVTSDPRSATECAQENATLRRIAAEAIEDTGGLFVTTPADDPDYADPFLAGCHATGVPVQEISPAQALAREPRINPGITRAFEVEDAAVDAWKLLWGNARSAREHGARVLTYHWVTDVLREGDRVAGVVARDDRGGDEVRIEAGFTINAGGVWAGRIAELAGCHGVTVVPGKGIMIAMNHRLVSTVINRCDPPGDGDILVPIRTVCVIGTTDVRADDPDDLSIDADEVQQMLDAGEVIVPGFRQTRALHAWTGARPLFHDERAAEGGVVILGADTVCAVGGRIIGQPRDEAHARDMINTLSDGEHQVLTGVALICPGTLRREIYVDESLVRVGVISDEQRESYLATGQWKGKAGAYNLSERMDAGWPLECVGDPTSVMGLPMATLEQRVSAFCERGGEAAA